MSKQEQKIKEILQENDIAFQQEYSFKDLRGGKNLLRFDFAIFDDNGELDCLIEFQGKQHYKEVDFFGGIDSLRRQNVYDKKKRNYCETRKIPLIVISYLEEDYLSLDFLLRKYDIACYEISKKGGF